jgi:hypothetical protein
MSGWTALTINVSDNETQARIDTELREQYEGREPYTAGGYADTTVQVGRHADHETVAKEFATEFAEAEHIAVVSANDTSDSGHGTLFRVNDDGSIEQVDREHGYEGARGNDVTGYFSEEYGVRSYSSFEA